MLLNSTRPHGRAIVANWIADPGAIRNLIDAMSPPLQSVRRTEWRTRSSPGARTPAGHASSARRCAAPGRVAWSLPGHAENGPACAPHAVPCCSNSRSHWSCRSLAGSVLKTRRTGWSAPSSPGEIHLSSLSENPAPPFMVERVSRRADPSLELGIPLPLPQRVEPIVAAGNQIPPRLSAGRSPVGPGLAPLVATGRTVSHLGLVSRIELGRPVAAIPVRPQRKRGYRPASQKDRNAGMSTSI